ncbi:hypothetical protein DHEL01_v202645 [Diaporthe helianthi]|uniref:Uncharacterized protein n=1 Tax=Diaporthe helianthi TaxID=158607 RepID=A0A2P5I8Y9_DIAHE|nr:hypothetical protein DHEL01_v202645 [Diaporthe helianthi]
MPLLRMSSQEESYPINNANSPPTPTDLGSYSRTMLQHTKRQMEAFSGNSERRSRVNGSRSSGQHGVGTPAMPNGVHQASSSPDDYHHT